jgi:polyisoprenoid-binding protein YceI
MSTRIISAKELHHLLQSKPALIILDVLPEENFVEAHIAGAQNACVYGVDFLDRCATIVPRLETPCVAYASSAASLASTTAVEKLAAAGYTELYDFKGGLTEWNVAGLPIEIDSEPATPQSGDIRASVSGAFVIDSPQSQIYWSGRNFGSEHTGTLRLADGRFQIKNGQPVAGDFTIDMTSMTNDDLPDSRMRQVLIDHLQSDDFFDVKRYPEARFVIEKTVPLAGAKKTPRYHVAGTLELKKKSNEVSFPSLVEIRDSKLIADASFEIDRTRWNVIYGSTRFYEKLGKHFVSDLIKLRLHIEAKRT